MGTVPNDSDNDGVTDSADAFPNDPAASVDSDGDGKPTIGTKVIPTVIQRHHRNSYSIMTMIMTGLRIIWMSSVRGQH